MIKVLKNNFVYVTTMVFFIIMLSGICFLICKIDKKDKTEIVSLGKPVHQLKTMAASFFEFDKKIYMIAATETLEGDYSQVFVYDIYDNKLYLQEKLVNACSVTSFCDIGDMIYFGTISRGDFGADLYCYDKKKGKLFKCVHFDEKGIYDLDWDQRNNLYIVTSSPVVLYSYDINNKDKELLINEFTNNQIARSITYMQGHCYIGIGTKAELLDIDIIDKSVKNILYEKYRDDSFVYETITIDNEIVFLLSPSYKICLYNPETGNILEMGYYENNVIPDKYIFGDGFIYNFSGGELFFSENNGFNFIGFGCVQVFNDKNNKVIYGLSMSGILYSWDLNGKDEKVDFYNILDLGAVIPTEVLAVGGCVYFPGRRFSVIDGIDGSLINSFVLNSEPQASFATCECVYTANYTEATVWCYPIKSLTEDNDLNDNKYMLSDIEHQCRPTQIDMSQDKKYLFVGTGPLYGEWGGAISVIDLNDNKLLYTYENVIDDHLIQSVESSNQFENKVWLGTSPYGENTYPESKNESSHVILWDFIEEKKCVDIVPDRDVKKIPCILEVKDGVLFVTQDACLYKYDFEGKKLVYNSKDKIKEIVKFNDEKCIAISDTAIMKVDLQNLKTKIIKDGYVFLTHLTVDVMNNEIYVFNNEELLKIDIED